ncbi:MAG TPA: hypothetical protein VN673_10395 [Clostridia bacterium]|nr:hypothetical protein [Clostridia bacterium]
MLKAAILPCLAVALSCFASSAAQTAQGRLYCLSVRIEPGFDQYVDKLNVNSTGLPDGAGELIPFLTPGTEIFFPPADSYVSNLDILDSYSQETFYGTLYLNLPPLVDANNNRYPDFFEVSQAVDSTALGTYSLAGYGSDNVPNVHWTRPAGSRFGMLVIPIEDGFWGTFRHTFEILEYSGPITYTPGSNSVSAYVDFTQTGNTSKKWKGPLTFQKSAENKFNEMTVQPSVWTNAAAQTFNLTNHLFFRETSWPNNYAGYIEFDDDGTAGSFYAWGLWVLSITDTNDANGNGVPDFTDDPAPPLPRRPQLAIARNQNSLALTIAGDIGHVHRVFQADSLTSGWQEVSSVTLTTDPQTVTVPVPASARFWRVQAQ